MIETPVKAPSRTSAPAAPAPDPRLRVSDPNRRVPGPPPEQGALHDHACAECGAPIHPDQAACLTCGTMVDDRGVRTGRRQAIMGSAVALLLLGGTVGAAVAGLPHGKKVPKKGPLAAAPKKPLPPATAGGAPSTGGATTKLPGSKGVKPPAIHTGSIPKTSGTPAIHSGTSTGGGGIAPSTTSGSTGGSSSSSNHHTTSPGTTSHKHKTTHHHGTSPGLYTTGVQPSDAGPFNGAGGDPQNLIDGQTSTTWSTAHTGVGVWVQTQSPPIKALGLIAKTAGYDASVYYSNAGSPPSSQSGWTLISRITNADVKQKVSLSGPARNAKYYLVVIDGLPSGGKATLSEIQLLQ